MCPEISTVTKAAQKHTDHMSYSQYFLHNLKDVSSFLRTIVRTIQTVHCQGFVDRANIDSTLYAPLNIPFLVPPWNSVNLTELYNRDREATALVLKGEWRRECDEVIITRGSQNSGYQVLFLGEGPQNENFSMFGENTGVTYNISYRD